MSSRELRRRTPSAGVWVAGLGALALALTASSPVAATVQGTVKRPVVAPYMDLAGPNKANLDAAVGAGLPGVTAAFVLGRGCTPVWDDGVPVAKDTAATAAIHRAQHAGVQVVVSFGGAAGKELARTCPSVQRLTAAYASVVAELGVTQPDFDVEGAAIDPKHEKASIARRFAAIRALKHHDPALTISATIAVGPTGLISNELSFLRVAQRSGTTLDLVNIMTMDYGRQVADMGAVAIRGAQGTLRQLRALWPKDGYANIGVTPMIGKNDSAGETFTVSDAASLAAFARSHHMGRLAFWSVNRDQRCSGAAARARGNCSGVAQRPLQFTKTFLGGAG